MTRAEILEQARICVCGEREQDYGTPENSFSAIADLWSAYLTNFCAVGYDAYVQVGPGDVACLMALLKVARIGGGRGTEDSFIDLAGYAACGGEIATHRPAEETGTV